MKCLERLANGLEQIRAMLGPEEASGISDKEIKDTLYHYYFDVQQSIDWILGVYPSYFAGGT